MYPLGLLFGLGFDTATEVGLLGISAARGRARACRSGRSWSFPALFTAGMSLIDTTDGILMLGAYGWAFVKPIRKLYYNLTITFVSVVAALVIGGIEVLSLVGDRFGLEGPLWRFIAMLADNFGLVGYSIVGFFVLCWIASYLLYRAGEYDKLEAQEAKTLPRA